MLRRSLQDLPPPAPPYSTEQSNLPLPSAADVTYNQPPPAPSSSEGSDVTPGILITVLVLAIAVILSASFYLLLRFLRRQRHGHHSSSSASVHHHHQQQQHHRPNSRQVSPVEKNTLIDALPLFPYESLNHSSAADCAVCLSKFEPKDLLRLLPICCHAFHAECIDTWLAANQSCPLCRSPIFLSENELLGKFRQNSLSSSSISSSSRSFRVEIGNVSRRNPPVLSSGEIRRSYSIGDSFDYVVDDAVTEVPAGSFRMPPEFKAEPAPMMDDYGALAAEVGPRGGWLKDYLSYSLSSSSRTTSFRGSGRWFFTGSSRRSTAELPPPACHEPELDLEASQLSNEIGELFRWLSGV